MLKIIFIASLFVMSTYAGATFTADLCNGLSSSINTDCVKTASAAGGATACCMATIADDKLVIPKDHSTGTDNNSKANDVKVVASATSGSVVASSNFYACFAPGGQFRFKTGAGVSIAAKEGFAKSEAICGTDGKTKATLAANGGPINMHTCASACASGDTVTDTTAKCTDSTSDKSRRGLCLEQQATTCACGTSGMPTDSCSKVAAADVKTKCTTTSDGGSPAKKCCLATFDALPTTKKSGATAQAIQAPTKGGKVDGTKYYACYKSSSGKIRFKTGASATPAAKEGWVSADSFCATAKVGKAQGGTTGVTFTHTVAADVTGSSTAGLAGTAKTCVCGASNIFTIGFMLLAILASLWK